MLVIVFVYFSDSSSEEEEGEVHSDEVDVSKRRCISVHVHDIK